MLDTFQLPLWTVRIVVAISSLRNATEADEGLRNVHRISGNRYTYEAGSLRSDFKDYLNNEGQVPWQWDHVRSCGQKL